MPEPYWPKRKGSYTLVDAAKHATFASVRCTYCKRQRYYLLADLATAFGNIECDDFVHVARMRCRQCGGKGALDFKTGGPMQADADKAWLVRIERIKYVRKIIWKESQGC